MFVRRARKNKRKHYQLDCTQLRSHSFEFFSEYNQCRCHSAVLALQQFVFITESSLCRDGTATLQCVTPLPSFTSLRNQTVQCHCTFCSCKMLGHTLCRASPPVLSPHCIGQFASQIWRDDEYHDTLMCMVRHICIKGIAKERTMFVGSAGK